jgi:hypothetical protein
MHLKREWPQIVHTYCLQKWARIHKKSKSYDKGNYGATPQIGSWNKDFKGNHPPLKMGRTNC